MRILFVAVLLLATTASFAQRRPASEADAQTYIMSAFLSQADPGAMAPKVAVGPELEKALGLAGAPGEKVYEAVVPLTGDQRIVVKRATPAELAEYGQRRGLDASSAHPLFTVQGGAVTLLVQYDLQALNMVYVGRLGLPDPDPKPVVAVKTVAPASAPASAPAPKKPAVVNVAWSAEFAYDSAHLTPELQARLDGEVLPKLASTKEIRYLHVYGHTDRLGSPQYNQQLSEKRAEAVRAYLVSKGIDADKIEVFSYGQTLPVVSCGDVKGRKALIECLAPNRRIVVEVQATP